MTLVWVAHFLRFAAWMLLLEMLYIDAFIHFMWNMNELPWGLDVHLRLLLAEEMQKPHWWW